MIVSELPSGMRVATQETTDAMATVTVYVATGSRFDLPELSGTAHFLEHMFFRGTPTRSQHSLEVEVEELGGQMEAWTTREHMFFIAHCFPRHVPKFVDLLGDLLARPALDPQAIEMERSVVLSELRHTELGVTNALHRVPARHRLPRLDPGPVAPGSARIHHAHRPRRPHRVLSRPVHRAPGGGRGQRRRYRPPDRRRGRPASPLGQDLPAAPPADLAHRAVRTPTRYVGSDCSIYTGQVASAHFIFGFEGVDAAHPDWCVYPC